MAGGSFAPAGVARDRAEQYQGKVTSYVIITCIVAAVGGSIFGYAIGISGGVTSMDDFLWDFFPTAWKNKWHAKENNYCKYNNQGLAAFTSSLYLAGLVASIVASPVTRKYGRRISIICGGISFLVGAALSAIALNLAMILCGRILLGVGIGFGNQSMEFKGNASVYSSALPGAVLALSMLVSIPTVDKWGRRPLLIGGGIQMIICQVILAIILGLKFENDKQLSKGFSILVVVVLCLFIAGFGWSWGPLGWTVPSEIFPLEMRSAGQSITVAVNLFFTFVISQSFLSLLCALKFGLFLFFAGWITIMTVFVYLFLPETKGVPIEDMILMWQKHWFWKKIVAKGDDEGLDTLEDSSRNLNR